jgi:ribosome-associated toxin RatA of RatAB toxin-antitoxin module
VKELRGSASAAVAASAQECLALLAAVDRYPGWYPEVVRKVDVLERDPSGQPTQVQTKLHLAQGPLTKDFDLVMKVTVAPPDTVKLMRVSHGASDPEAFDVDWRVDAGAHTEIRLDLRANLSVPRLLPIGGIGDTVAVGFVTAASRALLDSTTY